jgi:sugar phosphate isomerase/epimerase
MDIAVPSWVIPGTYAENLRFLDSKEEIRTVELLFFLYDEEVRSLLDHEWDALISFKDRFRFTAHLPDFIRPEHEELVERLSPLVSHFVAHPYPVEKTDELAELLGAWIDRYDQTAKESGPHRFLLENTLPGRLEAALTHLPLAGICFDTGHWILQGGKPADFVSRYGGHAGLNGILSSGRSGGNSGDRIGEVHLHAVDEAAGRGDGRLADHRALRGDEAWLEALVPYLGSFSGVVDLEVFSWAEVSSSLSALMMRGLVPERMQRL